MNKSAAIFPVLTAAVMVWAAGNAGGGQNRAAHPPNKPARTAAAASKTPSAGGPEAGRVNRIAVNPADPKIVYAGTSSGGVFRSTNGGETWTHSSRGIIDPQIGGLLVYPPDPKVVIACTPSGIFRSADEGRTWMRVLSVERVLPPPDLPSNVFEMQKYPVRFEPKSRTVYAAPLAAGLFKSSDGGQHWVQAYGEGPASPKDRVVLDIEFSPENGGTIFIATLGGLRRSRGSEWEADGAEIVSPKSHKPLSPVCVRIAPSDPKRMYVTAAHLGASPLETTVWRRTAPNGPFTLLAQAKPPWVSWSILQCLVIDPARADHLWAGGVQIHASSNGGETWTFFDKDLDCHDSSICGVDYRDLVIDPKGTYLYGAHDQGLFRCDYRARTIKAAEKGLVNTQFYDLDVGPNGTLYGGTQDTGAFCRKPGGAWEGFATGGSGDVLGVVADPHDDSRTFIRINAEQLIIVSGFGQKQTAGTGLPSPGFWNHLLVYCPSSKTLYAGTEYKGVYKSTNDGKTFAPANGGLADQNIRCLAVAPGSDKIVLAGTVKNGLYKTTDGGAHWQKLDRFPNETALALKITPGGRTIYAGTTGGIYVSTDGGASWTARNAGLPERKVVGELSSDPKQPQILYAGLGYFSAEGLYGGGVYESRNEGTSWTPLGGEETRPLSVTSIRFDPRDAARLWVATYGSGMIALSRAR
jgi:photosystem II stability/assembly factor-like uncharacterized protein